MNTTDTRPAIRIYPMRRELRTFDAVAEATQEARNLPKDFKAYLDHLKANEAEMERRSKLAEGEV